MSMGDNTQITGTSTFTLDNVGNRDAILVPVGFGACHLITIWETNGTSKYTISNVQSVVTPGSTYPPGYEKKFRRSRHQPPFQPGEVLCYGEVPVASITFNIMGEEEVMG